MEELIKQLTLKVGKVQEQIIESFKEVKQVLNNPKWEYRFEVLEIPFISLKTLNVSHSDPLLKSKKQLDELGKNGWETVSFEPARGADGENWAVALLKKRVL